MIFESKNTDLKCLILFGSHARGDQTISSDIDLLGIDDSQKFTVRNIDTVNFSFYSSDRALHMSCSGDLFFMHIVNEGRCLFNDPFFEKLKSCFNFKESYLEEASTAYYLGLKIIELSNNITNWKMANKRISWCVRTILIALSAENRTPFFSKSELSNALIKEGCSHFESLLLIDAKNSQDKDERTLELLSELLKKYSFLHNLVNKKNFYSNGIVHTTLDAIINSIPISYD
ncbi:nucleotidyltransferase domain-containing protein [Citrobacter sp. R56]|uniref:nucleotidyltransferase domain-containing protein n=1 Tax=Citrobacter sp. R56 TaxID=1573676 RepID=UPI00193B318F|nr:nucleotidyltransferase domain-containing protein [Citrobacter sp. R56]QRG79201.1 hypothetical protein JM656_00225 [Citrobacter sp. R56]